MLSFFLMKKINRLAVLVLNGEFMDGVAVSWGGVGHQTAPRVSNISVL